MQSFTRLYTKLDQTTKTTEKVDALVSYFEEASEADAAWAIYFLCGKKPRRLVKTSLLRTWAAEVAGMSDWLFAECYDSVGDLAETIALILPEGECSLDMPLNLLVNERLLRLRSFSELEVRESILATWQEMDAGQRFIFNKLLTGAFRVGVSQSLVTRALGKVASLDPRVIAHRLMGHWEASPEFYRGLIAEETDDTDRSRPYPFYLAHPLDGAPEDLGEPSCWSAEWKWDGIRAQLVRRQGETYIWSRGEELVTEQFPELASAARNLPDGTVIDGEIICWSESRVLPFSTLQRRLGRKRVGKTLLKEAPVAMMAYDLLEYDNVDIREQSLEERRACLRQVTAGGFFQDIFMVSPSLQFASWQELTDLRQGSRERAVEGLMLKRLQSPYQVGRQRGDWWKWKVDPYSIDAVLIYAQRGHGRRASLYSDYTFAVWEEEKLVPFAKAYSGLTDEEIRQVDAFVKRNTLERFGPVRVVKPELVFELAFEGIQESNRHKSGIAVRFPRMSRWRQDKPADEANSLAEVKALISKG
ncbi:MAG: ATP-dependent DNA ligase [Cyanobacteriota/Melainabacteria group bacterium]|nr:ATP-dependent DNA ligase [Cyanobacteria bacterium HKST-UBA01]